MTELTTSILCDGCGLPASPEHIAERLHRLELATRFRPIHINKLFIGLAPVAALENDFYGPPVKTYFFSEMMNSAGLISAVESAASSVSSSENKVGLLNEFQRGGNYIAYLSECPLPTGAPASEAIARLGENLARRIRFNYKPKQIFMLGEDLVPLGDVLRQFGVGASPEAQEQAATESTSTGTPKAGVEPA